MDQLAKMDQLEKVTIVVGTLPEDTAIADRVKALAQILNEIIDMFETGIVTIGSQAFQNAIMKAIRAARLVDKKWLSALLIRVHPDNREKVMVVPVDVHGLLQHIKKVGWFWPDVQILGCYIPPNALGDKWRAANTELIKKADGLLADTPGEQLEVLTARGSHTTQAVRCMLKGTKGLHDDLCVNGHISRSKIVESQPSMDEPCVKGVEVEIVYWELVQAVPRLMEILSRTGNASHGIHRKQTALQAVRRTHRLALSLASPDGIIDWAVVAKAASQGMDPDYESKAVMYAEFARVWSGGANGSILQELEDFERVLTIKRKINPHDLLMLSKQDIQDAPMFIAGMVKALLAAPPNFVTADGMATVFTHNDFTSLATKHRKQAVEAQGLMREARDFFDAYSSLHHVDKFKHISDFDIRLVMHVMGKRSTTRTNFKSVSHIAAQLYDEVKRKDDRIPKWQRIAGISVEGGDKKVGKSYIQEVDMGGDIDVAKLELAGFKVDAVVSLKSGDASDVQHIIKDISTNRVTLKKKGVDETPKQAEETKKVVGKKQKQAVGTEQVVGKEPNQEEEETTILPAELFAMWRVVPVMISKDPLIALVVHMSDVLLYISSKHTVNYRTPPYVTMLAALRASRCCWPAISHCVGPAGSYVLVVAELMAVSITRSMCNSCKPPQLSFIRSICFLSRPSRSPCLSHLPHLPVVALQTLSPLRRRCSRAREQFFCQRGSEI